MKLDRTHKGFTLVEIMIVVAIIAMLAAIAVPNFLRARKRSQATRILNDLRLIDAAIDQYAIETNKSSGYTVAWGDVKYYLKTNTTLYSSNHLDLLGGDFGANFTVDTIPVVPATTFSSLSDVAPAEFWSPFK